MNLSTFCDLFVTEITQAGFAVEEVRESKAENAAAELARKIIIDAKALEHCIKKLGTQSFTVYLLCDLLGKDHLSKMFKNDKSLMDFLQGQELWSQGAICQVMEKVYHPAKLNMWFTKPAALEIKQHQETPESTPRVGLY